MNVFQKTVKEILSNIKINDICHKKLTNEVNLLLLMYLWQVEKFDGNYRLKQFYGKCEKIRRTRSSTFLNLQPNKYGTVYSVLVTVI